MPIKKNVNNNAFSTSRKMLVISSLFLFLLLIAQTISSSIEHHNYQKSLMESVTTQIILDYQNYFSELRSLIDQQQKKQISLINSLVEQGEHASKDDYLLLMDDFKKQLKHSKLFTFIEPDGNGSFSHITGDFLSACKEEIQETIKTGKQERIFLHRNKKSIHFDLLQPLLTDKVKGKNNLLFVAFNADVLKGLLEKYQLPHQELFLMRSDEIGKVELTSDNNVNSYLNIKMTLEEFSTFDYVKKIKGTRWQVAIRLDAEYSRTFFIKGIVKAIVIWIVLTLIIYWYYRNQSSRSIKYSQIQKKLQYNNDVDQLTGLYNRAFFGHKIMEQINERVDNSLLTTGVVLHVDIDQFQVINNNFGYDVGDKFLYIISCQLIKRTSENVTISRLGNDEFAILIPDLAYEQAKEYAQNLKKVISEIDFHELNQTITLTASVGIVMLDAHQQNKEQVFSSLAQALSLAKEKGRNRVQLYQCDDKRLIQHANDMAAVHELSSALQENKLVLYRQEIRAVEPLTKNKHYEVLVRMKDMKNDIIPPIKFIQAAEKYGLITKLDFWVIGNTFNAIANSTEEIDSSYSINLSGLTIADKDLYPFVKEQFEKHKIKYNRICFEITETTAITHLEPALFFMEEMTKLGCTFSLDDFGSGLSSFNYLQALPVHIIKIDGCFIRDINSNKINNIFVENIQRTAQAMGKRTVAEYVESAEIEITLHKIGVDFVQGYYIHKPEPWFEFIHSKTNT